MASQGLKKSTTMLVTAVMLLAQSFVTSQAQCACTTVLIESAAKAVSGQEIVYSTSKRACCEQKDRHSDQSPVDCDCGCRNDGQKEPLAPEERDERSANGIESIAALLASPGDTPDCNNGCGLRDTTSAHRFIILPVRVRCCVWLT
ncbi:MAG: hypothetical protein P8J37_17690 [Fuerstiella sp.]|nr:hypothetical protein [Fuerstiella sp.]